MAIDPEDPAILNETALRELRSGNLAGARELLERAVARDVTNTRLLINLAGTLRQLGLADEEMRTIERVHAVEPRHLFALLQKATLLESQGKQRAATKANDAALDAYLNERLQELRDRHAGDEQDRLDHRRSAEAWVLDDSIEHEAWNDSDVPRAILILDVWNPYLTAAERDLVRATVTGIARYYGDCVQ
jgi:tetratricopeptide (TPR) repeat protein